MGFSKRYKKQQKGGGTRTGIDVNSIAAFNPTSVSGLVFWIQASNSASIRRTPVAEYAAQQLPMIRISLLDQYASNPSEQVITELTSGALGHSNSLVRVEAAESLSSRFPLLYEPATGEAPSIDVSPPLTLMSKEAIDLPDKHTILVDGGGVIVRYNTTLDRILVSADSNAVSGAPTYATDVHGKTVRVPTAHFRELLVFDRELTPEEQQRLEGYFAYQSNTQYLLPPGHPYLPDMASDPAIGPPLGKLTPLLTTISAAKLRLETDYKAYVAKVGKDALEGEYNGIVAKLDQATGRLNQIRQALFKGVLSARAKAPGGTGYTLEEVYALVNGASLLPGDSAPLGNAAIEAEVASTNAALQTAKDFLPKLATAEQKVAEKVVAMNQEAVVAARQEAETEERLRDVEAVARRREFVRAQIRVRAELDRLGDTLLNPLVEAFHAELQTTREAFDFQEKEWRERIRAMEALVEPLRLLFAGEDWVQQFAEFADVGKTEGGEYKTPTLQVFAEVFRSIAAAAGEGDIAYLKRQLERTAKDAVAVMAVWEKNRSLALFRRLYVAHVRQAYERAERWSQQLAERVSRVEAAAKQLAADMESFQKYREVSPFRPTFPMETFLPLEPIYVARLSPGDAALLLGYTHIRVDAAGVPRAEMNAAGDLDVEFLFPGPAATAAKMSLESGYVDPKTKTPILQHYFFVAPQAKSILDRLPPSRIPPLKPLRIAVDVSGATATVLELSRDLVNTVVQVTTEGAVQPLSLPKYAVPAAAFFCIQNVGADPLWVRNPGAVDDILDLVGPGEVGVYMYGEGTSLSSTPGFAYGHQVWQEGRLPYDTLLRSPRSAYSVFVKELKAAIYCLPTGNVPTALVDADGYFVPVRTAADGNVYDVDDFAQSNPYTVRTLPEVGLTDLAFDRLVAKGQVRPGGHTPPKIPAMRDSKTGAVILGSRPGIPAADEFGIGKFVLGPILWLGGAAKCKGSGDDLELEFGGGLAQPFLFPEGLAFHRLFRSQFCRPFRLEGGALAPVFTTAQEIPILGPSGEFILIPPNSAPAGANDLFVYAEPAGTMYQIFLLSKDAPLTEGKAAHVPFQQTEAAVHNTAVERKARNIMTRFISGFEYSKGTPKRLQDIADRLLALGEAITESVRSAIRDTIGMVEERLKTFTEFEGMIERVQRAMKDGEVPNEVVMSLGVLELKLRDKMMEIMELTGSIQKPVENFQFLLDRRDAAKKFVERMRTQGDEIFKRGYAAIQYLYKVHLERTKSISAPEIDATAAQLKTAEVGFKTKQGDLEGRLATQPDTVAELREWLLDLQERAGKQFTELQEVENLVTFQVVAKMKGAEEADTAAAKKELEALRAQADLLRAAGRRYADLFEVRDAPSALVVAAEAAEGPFAHLKTPSIEKDLLPVLGQEAVQAIERQGPDIAVLWGQLNQRSVTTVVPNDAAAARTAVGAARETVDTMNAAVKEMETRMKVPFEIYANTAKVTVEGQKRRVTELVQKVKGAVADLDTQRMAIEAATQSLGDTVTEEERGKLKSIQDAVDAVAATYTADSLKAQLDAAAAAAAETNPFAIAPTIRELEAAVATGEATQEKMKEPIQRFQEFRTGLTERLRTTFEERRKALSNIPPAIAERNPTDLLDLLDAIGEVGRVAASQP
jgi:hypothetical protein